MNDRVGRKRADLQVRNLQRRIKVDGRSLAKFLRRAADEVGVMEDASGAVVLVGDARMRTLNRDFRKDDRPTDVLSFSPGGSFSHEGECYLGDIVISADKARHQALQKGWDLQQELRLLTLHGLLHLMGYDHESDEGEMGRLEYRLRRKLGLIRKRTEGKKG